MSRNNAHNFLIATTLAAGVLLAAGGSAGATPIVGHYQDDARCDSIPTQSLNVEIGDQAFFPANSAISYHDHRLNFGIAIGVPDDGIANDWTVHMTNVSGIAWTNLFFVADLGATIGNADGVVEDAVGAPNTWTDAFHIDATGSNANLLFESMNQDGVFEPGEQWEFAVMNFGTGAISTPPVIISPGVFAGSSLLGAGGGITSGNASIIGVPATVPEPATIGIVGLGAMALLARRPRRTHRITH